MKIKGKDVEEEEKKRRRKKEEREKENEAMKGGGVKMETSHAKALQSIKIEWFVASLE